MNPFLLSARRALQRNGLDLQYKSNTRTVNPVNGVPTTTTVTRTVRAYPRHLEATQFNYPSLIGKDAVMFYLNGDISFKPGSADVIEYDGKQYRISTVQSFSARGQICLYTAIGVSS